MNETCQQAKTFLSDILSDLRFDLSVSAEWTEEGCILNLSGKDISFLMHDNGEMLDAFETLLFQIYGRELERTQRFICDADGFRQTGQNCKQWRDLPRRMFEKTTDLLLLAF
jgi:predicted RNA-binding protein Jag